MTLLNSQGSRTRVRKIAWLILALGLLGYSLPRVADASRSNWLGIELTHRLVGRTWLDIWTAPDGWETSVARDQFSKECSLAAGSRSAAYLAGICWWIAGDTGASLFDLQQAPRARQDLTNALEGQVYLSRGDRGQTLRSWTKGDLPSRLSSWAESWRAHGHFAPAAHVYEILASQQPEDVALQLTLAQVYLDAKDYDRAKLVLDGILARDPRNFDAQSLSMYVLAFGQGAYEQAVQFGLGLLEQPGLRPDQRAGVYWMLGTIERGLGHFSSAVDFFTHYRDTGTMPKWYGNFAIAQTYRMAGTLPQAAEAIENAAADAPTQAVVLTERGLIRVQSGQIEVGLHDLQQAIQSQPDDDRLVEYVVGELRQMKQNAIACRILKNVPKASLQNDAPVCQ